MSRNAAIAALGLTAIALAACKPPPTDADIARDMPAEVPQGPSEPLDSPDIEGAVWAASATPWRIIYGKPGEAPLVSLECVETAGDPNLRVTRYATADEGAGAILAFVGNDRIGRMKVDAIETNAGFLWRGEDPAVDQDWEPLIGPEEVTLTVPGAGMVTLNPSPLPVDLVTGCRGGRLEPLEGAIDEATIAEAAPEASEPAQPAP